MSPADTMDRDSPKIDKLRGQANWMQWKFDIRMAMIDKDVWDVVDPETTLPNPVTETQRKALNRSLAIIGLCIDTSQKLHILSCKTGREGYEKLSGLYDTTDMASQLARKTAFQAMRQRADEPVTSWTARVEAEAAECKLIGCHESLLPPSCHSLIHLPLCHLLCHLLTRTSPLPHLPLVT
jgi:hypothetical protein